MEDLETGSTTHMFNNYGVIHLQKNKINEEDALEIAINSGAKDCYLVNDYHEILTEKEDFYKVKTTLEKKIDNLKHSAIEWRAQNYLNLDKEQSIKMIEVLNLLEELDDVQNIFTNANLKE